VEIVEVAVDERDLEPVESRYSTRRSSLDEEEVPPPTSSSRSAKARKSGAAAEARAVEGARREESRSEEKGSHEEISCKFIPADALVASLAEFAPFADIMSPPEGEEGEDFLAVRRQVDLSSLLPPHVLSEYTSYYSVDTVFILERQIQQILKEMECFTVDAHNANANGGVSGELPPSHSRRTSMRRPHVLVEPQSKAPPAKDESREGNGSHEGLAPSAPEEMGSSRVRTRHSQSQKEPAMEAPLANEPEPASSSSSSSSSSPPAKAIEEASVRELAEEFMDIPYELIPSYDTFVRKVLTIEIMKR
jgi:hypothetical protein